MKDYIYVLWGDTPRDFLEPSYIVSYHKTLLGAFKAKKERLLNDYNSWYSKRRQGEEYQKEYEYYIKKIEIKD